MKGFWIAAAALALQGCIAFACSNLLAELRPYKGRDVHELAARLGPPDRETPAMTVWQSPGFCTIKALTDERGFAQQILLQGNNGGCSQYLSLMRRR